MVIGQIEGGIGITEVRSDMTHTKEMKKDSQLIRINVEFQIKDDHLKNDKPLQDVFEIILNNINLSKLVNSGDG